MTCHTPGNVPVALTIATSDPSGGAGIQADLKTFSALGVYGTAVLVALTAQNTRGVTGIHVIPPAFIAEQVDTLVADVRVDAVKIGMLADATVVHDGRRGPAPPSGPAAVGGARPGDGRLQRGPAAHRGRGGAGCAPSCSRWPTW